MKKKEIAVLCVIFATVLLLGAVLLFAVRLYLGTGLSELEVLQGAYAYNGKLLLCEDGEQALLYKPLGNVKFDRLSKENVDLSPFGFEGKIFSYFRVDTEASYGISFTNLYPTDPAYEGFWPVCDGERFVFVDEDGKKYCIHPREDLCYPVFSDSIEGVDPYGTDVIAFSADASYALSLEGDEVTVYQTDPTDSSLRIVSVRTVSLSQYANEISFGAFVGNTQAYFVANGEEGTVYVALDCATGETARSQLDAEGTYGNAISRLFAQRYDGDEEDEGFYLRWSHLLLGTEYRSAQLEGVSQGEIFSVSPNGKYAVARVTAEGKEEIFVVNEKRSFSLTSVLEDDRTVQKVDFLYENVIAVSLSDGEGNSLCRVYKICF